MRTMKSINPADGSVIKEYNIYSSGEVESILSKAQQTFIRYRRSDYSERKEKMMCVADELENNSREYAEIMTLEMGKTFASAVSEVEKCAWVCRYYAEHAQSFLADEMVETEATKSKISYCPIGIVLAVMPWNYPFWQVFRFAAPALMAGNVCLLKHASNVPGSALAIQSIFGKGGFPKGAFSTLLISSDQVASVIEDSRVKSVTLTGSGPAGSAVAAVAGKEIKKSVLELGGSDAYIVLKDADITLAAEQCYQSRILNAGQSCIGAKRFIIVDEIYDQWLSEFKSRMEASLMGNPMQEVDLGPMAREDLRDEVHEQVVKSVENGAELLIGGFIPNQPGSYYPPTILADVSPGMPAYDEEIFGPVASVIRVKDEEEAIKVANDTIYGLGACVFTNDLARGERIATEELEAGCCFVNQFVKSDPRLPFGGIKASGYGRELSRFGIREFVNIKSVWIK
ncbi:MAG: NAD-dependent succinate-semialdehyde dehydrogenase [Saprospiraceae bacterium]|nr:NAD-dependent succinate-semialdehyde dehydrogenase [Saprospiraceae bacterium]